MDTIRGRSDTHFEGEGIMGTFTWETGLGMLGLGMFVILIGGLIIWIVLNHKPKKEKYGD